MRRVGDLEVDQDLDFERAVWVVQRVGWAAMTLVLVAALAGLLGPGPASWTKAEAPDGDLVAEYHRFVRANGPTDLEVSLGRAAVRDGRVRLWLDRAYLGGAEIERVTPEPESVEVGPDRLVYVFAVSRGGQAARVSFALSPRTAGPWDARLGVEDGADLAFRQFVYP